MDPDKYLELLEFPGPRRVSELSPSIELLKTLQRCHHLTVPYNNLDVFLNRRIELNL